MERRLDVPDREEPGPARRAACEDCEACEACEACDWYHAQINRAAGDPKPRADLEALFGAHVRHKHAPAAPSARGFRSV
ncbi:hypothetical protein OHB04_30160 [Streptomyces sp. NBC_01775]|uniref:hypothetical protein n=1 Tax=Streptomyces sp. NBC_01775 TaxID=2975939 RepID=UPI002DD874C4|nr:hypothetical protein [Streptomyces sp. NBC_01775]WSB79571.1 hypothetical protein OHB04_30160 [Streptomyces sp. NBC_01775]